MRNQQVALAVFALTYFLLARFGMSVLSLQPANITLLWLPSGIALIMCLRWGYRAVPWIIAASFAANASGMHAFDSANAFVHTLFAALIDSFAGLLAALLYRHFLPDGLRRVNDLVKFVFYVCLLPTWLSAMLLALNLVAGNYIAASAVTEFIGMLVQADSLGMLLILPIYQGWLEATRPTRACVPWMSAFGIVLAISLAAGMSFFPSMLFFIFPILLVLSFNVQPLGVAAVSALALIAVIAGTARGLGPLVAADMLETNYRLMAFVFSAALTVFGMALQRRQLRESEQSSSRWRDIAERDPLTGLINRRDFLPRLNAEHQRALRTGHAYTVVMLDLDHFKSINDTYGHAAGDMVLQAFAVVALQNSRAVDTVARLGGEEFCILLPESSAAQATVAMERLRSTVERLLLDWQGQSIRVTVSIGIATIAAAMKGSANDVLTRADKALYVAKRAGRNQVVIDEV